MEMFEDLLIKGALNYSVELDEEKVKKFKKYMELVLEWNRKINLTSIDLEEEIIEKHFIDSLSILRYIKNNKSIIDIGTGAGFPGIPIKIANPSIEVVLVDSLNKRINFLKKTVEELSLEIIEYKHGRAEELGNDKKYREKFDYAVARAVSALPVLIEYCLPFVKKGGTLIAMKGSLTEEELESCKKALNILGGEITNIEKFCLPYSFSKRTVILIKKIRQTPTGYPRKPGKPKASPLL